MDQSGLSLGSGKGAGSLHTGTKPTPWSRRCDRVTVGHLSKFDQKKWYPGGDVLSTVEILQPTSTEYCTEVQHVLFFSDAGSPRGG